MKTNIKMIITMILVVISSFAGSFNISAQSSETAIKASHLDLANRVGNTSFTAVIKDGHLTCHRHQGWYLGANGGANFSKVANETAINPNLSGLVGYEFKNWHTEIRAGETQFSYMGSQKFGFQTDLGIYYDFMPIKDRKFNIYAGAFGGYQHVKFLYQIEDCDVKVTIPYKGNSLRYGAEIGANWRMMKNTSSAGIYARVFTYKYNAGENYKNPIVGEVGLRLTFGICRKVKYN